MRAALFALLALGGASTLDVTPAAANSNGFPFSLNSPSGFPFCMRTLWGDDDCSYRTYAQCAVTASGVGLTCFANPARAYTQNYDGQQIPRRVKHKRNRSSY